MINFDVLRSSEVHKNPYVHFTNSDILTKKQALNIRRDYPQITKSGFLLLSELNVQGAFKSLIDDLNSPTLASILSEKLDLELSDKPRMVTVRKVSKPGDGRVHTDGVAKLCTMLIYLNETWDASEGGAIRVYDSPDDMNNFVKEVEPLEGNIFAFKRSDNSWHGHLPFSGERYVVQVTFLQDDTELKRKEKRGRLQCLIKSLNPFAR